MKAIWITLIAALMLPPAAQAQSSLTRTDLQRHDLNIPGQEVVQVLVGFPPGSVAPPHKHPGEEIIYVTEGAIEYKIGDQPATTVKAGEVTFVPAGVVHSARNVGTGPASELATYVVEKGKPLVTLVK